MKGRWDLDKRPVAFAFTADLRCGVCGFTKVITFESRQEASALPAEYPGDWARIGFVGGHADPLARDSDIVVCGRDCGESAARTYLDSIWVR